MRRALAALAVAAAAGAFAAEPAPNAALHAFFEREFLNGLQEHPERGTLMGLEGYDVQFSQWTGLFVPAGTPEPVIAKLREAARAAVQDPAFKSALAKVETPIQYLDQPQFAAFWHDDARKLASAVQRIGRVD